MKYVELREGVNEAGECPITLDQSGVGEEQDGTCLPKDDDVVAVIPEDVVRFLKDHVSQINGLPSLLFVQMDDVCDGPLVHRWSTLLFDLHGARVLMVTSINLDRFNIN